MRFYVSNRRARMKRCIVKWSNIEKMQNIYAEAKEKGLHVDHIIPIMHDLVCGLHCEDNLQLLTPIENQSKGNIYHV